MNEINPYASPLAGGDGDQPAEGPLAWTDGHLLVVHRRAAALPPLCLETGEPATRWRPYDLVWSYPIDWAGRKLHVRIPLGELPYRRYRRLRISSIAVFLLPCVATVLALTAYGKLSLSRLA
jgi:hypothetical protein